MTVILKIKGGQVVDGEENNIELVTEGKLERISATEFKVQYDETEITGMGQTSTTINVKDNKVVITRKGDVSNEMVFEDHKNSMMYYEVLNQSMMISIFTESLYAEVDKNGLGEIDLNYQLTINNDVSSINKFNVLIMKK